MKRLAIVVMFGIIGGNILINAEQHNREHPIVYTAEAYEEPRTILIEVIPTEKSVEDIRQLAQEYAEKYRVPFNEMWDTILCESGASTTIQSYHIRKDGTREQSYGLAQIHLPDHPTVTKEQAIDPNFALDFMAKNWHKVRWYCRDK